MLQSDKYVQIKMMANFFVWEDFEKLTANGYKRSRYLSVLCFALEWNHMKFKIQMHYIVIVIFLIEISFK